jgi:hypothetical protein
MRPCIHCGELFDRKVTKPPLTCSAECKRAVILQRVKAYYLSHWALRQAQQKAYKLRVRAKRLSRGLPCTCTACGQEMAA